MKLQDKINRRTAIKSIGLTGIAVGGIIMGTNCCSPKKEDVITYNEADLIPCQALDCKDCDCKSNNESACCPTDNNTKKEDACCDNDNNAKKESACCPDDNNNTNAKKERCDCKAEPHCSAGVYISEHFILYNELVKEGNLPDLSSNNLSERGKEKLQKQCRAFLSKMNKIPKEQRAERCTQCGECIPYCEHIESIQDKIVHISDLIKQVEKYK